MQRFYKQEPQDIITNPLIEGLDGRKMSSSWGNTVNLLDSADEMFGKIMSLKDEFIIKYFTLVTRVRLQEIEEIKKIPNPRDQKAILAKEIVKMYHGEKLAERAEKEFNKIFRNKELPSDMPVLEIPAGKYNIIDLLCLPAGRQATPLVPSKNEAKRLVEQKAVEILNGENKTKITDWKAEINLENGTIIKVGGRRFMKLKLK